MMLYNDNIIVSENGVQSGYYPIKVTATDEKNNKA